jgi:hypothetical protein
MVTIFNERAIKIAWTIYKGVSAVKENFDRANVVVFLIDHRGNKINVGCRQEMGTLYVDIPAGALHEGIYSIEAIWAKNRDFTRPHSWEMAPWVLNHTFMDSRNIVRCLKEDLFAVTEYIREQAGVFPDEGTVVVKAKSSAATYGYDGLDAYEMSVVLGYTTLSRDEWLSQMNDPQTWFMTYLGELIRLNNLITPGARQFNVTKVAGHWDYNPAGEEKATEGLAYHIQIVTKEHYIFDTEGLQLTMFGYPITEETEGVTIVYSDENTTLDITIENVTGDIRIEPSALSESGTITLYGDTEHPSNPLWRWLDSSNQPITEPISGSYDTPTTVYLELLDAAHYELPSEGIYYDDAGEGSCEISATRVAGTNKYAVTLSELSGNVAIMVNLVPLTVEINTSGLHGFDVEKYVDNQRVTTVYKGQTVTIKVKPTDPNASIQDQPKYKLGSTGTPTSFGTADEYGWQSIELVNLEVNVYLIGEAVFENRVVWGEYTQPSFDSSAIQAYLMQDASTMFNDAVAAEQVVNGTATATITTTSFFVCYPSGHFPTMEETNLHSQYDLNSGVHQTVRINGNPNYVIWAFYNDTVYPINGEVVITTN